MCVVLSVGLPLDCSCCRCFCASFELADLFLVFLEFEAFIVGTYPGSTRFTPGSVMY